MESYDVYDFLESYLFWSFPLITCAIAAQSSGFIKLIIQELFIYILATAFFSCGMILNDLKWIYWAGICFILAFLITMAKVFDSNNNPLHLGDGFILNSGIPNMLRVLFLEHMVMISLIMHRIRNSYYNRKIEYFDVPVAFEFIYYDIWTSSEFIFLNNSPFVGICRFTIILIKILYDYLRSANYFWTWARN